MPIILIILCLFITLALIALLWLGLVPRQLKKAERVIKSLAISALKGVASNEYIQAYHQRHNKFFHWLGKRLTKGNFNGLTLTIMSFIFFWALLQLAGITEDFASNDTIVLIDQSFDKLMLFFRNPAGIRFFLFFTALGSLPVALTILASLSYYAWINRRRLFIVPLWLTYLSASAASLIGKLALHRARPPFPVYSEANYSFPSGHATTAVAVYGFLIYFVWKYSKNRYRKFFGFVAGCLIIFLIGFSRLYLGVHYLSDVWAGSLLGLLWLIAGISWAEWRLSHPKHRAAARGLSNKHKKRVALACTALIITTAILFQPAPNLISNIQPTRVLQNFLALPAGFGLDHDTQTMSAKEQEPLSLIIAAYPETFTSSLQAAGWMLADKISWVSTGKMIAAAIKNSSYPSAPMTPSFWEGGPHDLGFEKSTAKASARQRYHARFWRSNLVTPDGRVIYVGTASYDIGLKWGVTHQIAPNIDTERERLFTDLQKAGLIASYKKVTFTTPTLGKNFSGDAFFSDGQAYLIELR